MKILLLFFIVQVFTPNAVQQSNMEKASVEIKRAADKVNADQVTQRLAKTAQAKSAAAKAEVIDTAAKKKLIADWKQKCGLDSSWSWNDRMEAWQKK